MERGPSPIVVGLPAAATEAYLGELAAAGAGEFFLGYVPSYWSERFGFEFSPNRRYFAGAQVTSRAHLDGLCAAARPLGIPVAVTFNEHFVTPAAMALGERLLDEAVEAGCATIIIADPSVLPLLRRRYPAVSLHVSGDAGVYNRSACEQLFALGATRIIFPRELPLADLVAIVRACRGEGREFEAFVMGEPCHFDGARCFTEHGYDFGCDFCNYHQRKEVRRRGQARGRPLEPPQAALLDDPQTRAVWGLGKCGLCAIEPLMDAGVTHFKVPGRASVALDAVALVHRIVAGPDRGVDAARAQLDAPALCASRTFCYYPEQFDD